MDAHEPRHKLWPRDIWGQLTYDFGCLVILFLCLLVLAGAGLFGAVHQNPLPPPAPAAPTLAAPSPANLQ